MASVRLDAATSSSLRSVLAGPARPAAWLGVTRAALYLGVPAMPGVVAVLAHGAVRLPCAMLLPTTAGELPLTAIGAQADGALLGDGCLAWTGPLGPVVVRTVREWAPARVRAVPEQRGWGAPVP